MSLFIAHLAFESPVYMHQAKMGILAACVIARLIGWTVLAWQTPGNSVSSEESLST